MLNRIKYLDAVRAICVLEIIVFWHMRDYHSIFYVNANFEALTIGTLSCYFFLSGVLSGGKKRTTIEFFINRFFRLYVPFVIAYLVMGICNCFVEPITIKTMFLSLTGLSCFLGHQPRTLWFVSMLLIFYIITPPFFYVFRKKKIAGVGFLLCIWGLFIFLSYFFVGGADKRLVWYFPFYSIGLLVNKDVVSSFFEKRSSVEKYIYTLFLLVILFFISGTQLYKIFLYGVIVIIFYFLWSVFISKSESFSWVISKLSYASLMAYLFHRPILDYAARWRLIGHGVIVETFVLVILFIAAYCAQFIYDKYVLLFLERWRKY